MWFSLKPIFNRRSPPPTLYSPNGEIISPQSSKLGDIVRAFLDSLPPNANHFQILIAAIKFSLFQSRRRKLISAGVLFSLLLAYPAIVFVKELEHKVPERGAQILTDKFLPTPAKPDPPKEAPEEPPATEAPPAVIPVIWYESSATLRSARIVECGLKFKAREAATRHIRFYISTSKDVLWLSPSEIVNGYDDQDAMQIQIKRIHDNVDRWSIGYMAKDQVLEIRYTVKFRGAAPAKIPKLVPVDPTRRIAFKPLPPESGSSLQLPDGARDSAVLAAALSVDLPAVPDLKIGQMFPERYAVSATESARFRNCLSDVSFSPDESGEQTVVVSGQQPDGCIYDPALATIRTTASADSSIAYTYDAMGNLLTIAEPSGATVAYSYDALNRLVRITDSRDRTTTFDYDEDETGVAVAGPYGDQTRYVYDRSSRLTALTTSTGAETKYAYDAAGNLISVKDALGGTRSFEYDANGNPTAVTDSTTGKVQYAYDALNHLTSVTSSFGTVQYTYDELGRRTSKTDANGYTTSYSYDANSRLLSVVNPLGNAVQFTYDPSGNVLSRTDANGNTTSYSYDVNDRLLSAALGNGIQYTYDYSGNRLSQIVANGTTFSFSYTYDPAANVSGPSITSLNPAAVTTGGAFTLTVNGSGFTSGAVVSWNGTALATSFVSANQLAAALPASFTASPGVASISVTNGGIASAPSAFVIVPGPSTGLVSAPQLLDTRRFWLDSFGNRISAINPSSAYVFNPGGRLGLATDYAYDGDGNSILAVVGDSDRDGLPDGQEFGASIIREAASGRFLYDTLARLVQPIVYRFGSTPSRMSPLPYIYDFSGSMIQRPQAGLSAVPGTISIPLGPSGEATTFAINNSGQIIGTAYLTFNVQPSAGVGSFVLSGKPTENNADIWTTIAGGVATGSLSSPIWVQVKTTDASAWWLPNQSVIVTGSEIGASGVWMLANADPSLVQYSLGPLSQGNLAWTVINSGSGSGFWLVPVSPGTAVPDSSSYLGARYYDPRLGRFISTDPIGPAETTTDAPYGTAGVFPLSVQIADDGGTNLQVSGTIISSTPDQASQGSSSSTSSQGPLIVTFADPGGAKFPVSGTTREVMTQESTKVRSTSRKTRPSRLQQTTTRPPSKH